MAVRPKTEAAQPQAPIQKLAELPRASQIAIREKFRKILAGKAARKDWGRELNLGNATREQAQSILDELTAEALTDGLLRADRNGAIRRTTLAKRLPRDMLTRSQFDTLSVPPQARVEALARQRGIENPQYWVGKGKKGPSPNRNLVANYAIDLELSRGTDAFDGVFADLKRDAAVGAKADPIMGKRLTQADLIELAHLVGYPELKLPNGKTVKLNAKTTRAQALGLIEQRHLDNKAFIEKQVATAPPPPITLASFAGEATDRQARELEEDVRLFEQSLWEAGRTGDEIAAAINERYRGVFDPVTGADVARRHVWWHISGVSEAPSFDLEYEPQMRGGATDNIPAASDIDARPPVPQQLSPMERVRTAPLQTNITPALRQRIILLYANGRGFGAADIAGQLTQETGAYVGPTEVANVLEAAGLFKRGFGAGREKLLPAHAVERLLDPEFGAQSLKDQAEALKEYLAGSANPVGAIGDARYRLRQEGRSVPEIAGHAVYSPGAVALLLDPAFGSLPLAEQVATLRAAPYNLDITEASLKQKRHLLRTEGRSVPDAPQSKPDKFEWTDAAIAQLTSEELRDLSDDQKARILDPTGKLTANALRTKRKKLRQERGADEVPLNRRRWPDEAMAWLATDEADAMTQGEAAQVLKERFGFNATAHEVGSARLYAQRRTGRDRSVTLMSIAADQSVGQSQRADLDALGFYSQALRAARELKQEKWKPADLLKTLRNTPNVKEAELEAYGVAKFLEGKKSVTRSELVSFLENNRVEVREAVYGGPPKGIEELIARRDAMLNAESYDPLELRRVRDAIFNAEQAVPRPKWSTYSLDPQDAIERVMYLPTGEQLPYVVKNASGEVIGTYPNRDAAFEAWKNSSQGVGSGIEPARPREPTFTDSHYPDVPNPIVILRYGFSLDPDGKRTMRIENFQSGWGENIRDGIRNAYAKEMFGPESEAGKARIAELRGQGAEASAKRQALDVEVRDFVNAHGGAQYGRFHDAMSRLETNTTPEGRAARELSKRWEAAVNEEQRIETELRKLTSEISWRQLSPDQKAAASKAIAADREAGTLKGGVRDEAKIQELEKRIGEARTNHEKAAEQAEKDLDALGVPPVPRKDWASTASERAYFRIEQVKADFERINRSGNSAKIGEMVGSAGAVDDIARRLRPLNDELTRLIAELNTAKAATPGHPFVNTTEQWVTTGLRRVITQAVEAGADRIALTPGSILVSRGEGRQDDPSGMLKFQDDMLPRALRDLLRKIDPAIKQEEIELRSSVDGRTFDDGRPDTRFIINDDQGGESEHFAPGTKGPPILFHSFPLTSKVKSAVQREGMALFALSSARSRLGPEDGREALAAMSERVARGDAYLAWSQGRSYSVNETAVMAALEALEPFTQIVPAHVQVRALYRIEPFRPSNDFIAQRVGQGLPVENLKAYYVDHRGLVTTELFFVPPRGDIGVGPFAANAIYAFDSRGGVVENPRVSFHVFGHVGTTEHFIDSLRGQLGHELVHALRQDGRLIGWDWATLVAASHDAGLLSKSWRDWGQTISLPGWETLDTKESVEATYRKAYKNATPELLEEFIDQEAVAHTLQALIHGAVNAESLGEARAIFERILSGEFGRGPTEASPIVTRGAISQLAQGAERNAPLDRLQSDLNKLPTYDPSTYFNPPSPTEAHVASEEGQEALRTIVRPSLAGGLSVDAALADLENRVRTWHDENPVERYDGDFAKREQAFQAFIKQTYARRDTLVDYKNAELMLPHIQENLTYHEAQLAELKTLAESGTILPGLQATEEFIPQLRAEIARLEQNIARGRAVLEQLGGRPVTLAAFSGWNPLRSIQDRIWALYVGLRYRGETSILANNLPIDALSNEPGMQTVTDMRHPDLRLLEGQLRDAKRLERDIRGLASELPGLFGPLTPITVEGVRERMRALPAGAKEAVTLALYARQLERVVQAREVMEDLVERTRTLGPDRTGLLLTEEAANENRTKFDAAWAEMVAERGRPDLRVIEGGIPSDPESGPYGGPPTTLASLASQPEQGGPFTFAPLSEARFYRRTMQDRIADAAPSGPRKEGVRALVGRAIDRIGQAAEALIPPQLPEHGFTIMRDGQEAGFLAYTIEDGVAYVDLVQKSDGGHWFLSGDEIFAFNAEIRRRSPDVTRVQGLALTPDDVRPSDLASLVPQPESRPFSLNLPGLEGSVTEKIKEGGERMRTYGVAAQVTAYHGTTAEVVGELRPMGGRDPFTGTPDVPAISLATTPEQADKFTLNMVGQTAPGASVRRVRLNTSGFREIVWPEFMATAEPKMEPTRWHPRAWQTLLRELRDSGTPGAIVNGMSDAGGSAPQYVVLDASRISDAVAAPSSSLIVSERPDGSWELTFFKSATDHVNQVGGMVAAIEADLGKRISPRGWLTPEGYQYWSQVAPDKVKFHQNAGELFGGMFASPRAVEFAGAVLGAARDQQIDMEVHLDFTPSAGKQRFDGPRASIAYEVDYDGTVEITSFHSRMTNRGEGNAARLLDGFLAATDEEGRRVVLDAVALDSEGLSQEALVQFYERRGFRQVNAERVPYRFAREPRAPVRDILRDVDRLTEASAHLSRLKSSLPQEAFQDARREERFSFASQPQLDMSPEARKARAEAMGFDTSTVWHHGTPHAFGAFEVGPERVGTGGGDAFQPASQHGVFLTRREEGARDYGKNVLALYVRPGKQTTITVDSTADNAADIIAGALETAKRHNLDSVLIRDVNQEVDEELVVFDPSNIRSVNAAFDPSQEGSPVLLASFASLRDRLSALPEAQEREFLPSDFAVERILPDRNIWRVRLAEPAHTNYVMGYASPSERTFRITESHLDEAMRGKGLGIAMYQRLIDEAHRYGYAVTSDTKVSLDAQRIYEALAERGYGVSRNRDGGPTFTVAPIAPQEGPTPITLASFAGQPPGGPPSGREIRPLADIISDLKSALGMTTTQGLYGMGVREASGGRTRWFRPQNARGQYDRNAGVARTRVSTDIEAIAHEGGHHLERVFGAPLETFKTQNAEELGVPAVPDRPLTIPLNPTGYSGMELDADTQRVLVDAVASVRQFQALQTAAARTNRTTLHDAAAQAAIARGTLQRRLGRTIADAVMADVLQRQTGTPIADYVRQRYSFTGNPAPRQAPTPSAAELSEGFAEFFQRYITDPDTVKRDMPGVYTAFEDFLDANDPAMLEAFEKVQLTVLSEDYKAYRQASAVERGAADVATMQPAGAWEQVQDWYGSSNSWGGRWDKFKQWVSWIGSGISYEMLDRTNPILKTQQALLRLADRAGVRDADGRPISLQPMENAHRISRMMSGADKIGHQMITHGVPDYQGLEPIGPSLHDALVLALGGTRAFQWSDAALKRFGLYLEARRAVGEWQRFIDGAISQPTRRSLEENQQIITELEEANPNYRQAAQMVYNWQHRLLTLEYHAGKWTKEAFDELSNRKDFYVPFMRDLSDLVPMAGAPPGTRMATRFTEGHKFKGSQRDIINPIETLIKRSHEVAAAVQFNDMVKALTNLSERAGPGGAAFIERVRKEETLAANQRTFERIKQNAIDLGVDPADAHMIVQKMEQNFTDANVQLLWEPDNLGPARPPIVPLWENGERKLVRLNDPVMGRRLFDAMNALGREQSNIWIRAIGYPASILRAGVTMHPAFVISNILADMQAAWALTGAPPVITQIKGASYLLSTNPTVAAMMRSVGITPSRLANLYSTVGGIAGGQNLAAIRATTREHDIHSLRLKGYRVLNLPALGGLGMVGTGAAIGGVLGGPVGATLGASVGAIAARLSLGEGAERAFAQLSEMSETVTRLGVASHAAKRARRLYPNMSDIDVIREAAFTARDVIDFDRAGARAGTLLKLIPFLNSNLQGVSKAYRQLLMLDGERGRVNMQKAALFLRWQLTGTGAFQEKVSARDQQAIRDGARVWVNMMILAAIGVAIAFMFRDDPEYDDVRGEVRNTHFVFKLWGTWFRIKKPFELAQPANIAEGFYEWMARNDPRLMRRIFDGFRETHMPPIVPQVYNLYTGWRTGIDPGRMGQDPRPIVPEGLSRLPPYQQYNAYSSAFAIAWSRSLQRLGVNISPMMIDWTLNNELAYWGREVRVTSDYFFSERAPQWTDTPVIGTMLNRFTHDPSRSSASIQEFWSIMGRGRGDFDEALAGYDNVLRGGNQNAITAYLAGLSEEERVYAITMRHFRGNDLSAHPLHRANIVFRINSRMRREMAEPGGLISTEGGSRGEGIPLSPAQRLEIDNILGRLSALEVWNALHAVGRPGWAARDVRDPQPLLDELRAASEAAYEEMIRRRRHPESVGLRGRVGTFQEDMERWRDVERRVHEMIQDENLLGTAWRRTIRNRRAPTRALEERPALQ